VPGHIVMEGNMQYSRRSIMGFLATLALPAALLSTGAEAHRGPHAHPHRKVRRKVRRRVRRHRVRRRTSWRALHGRRYLVVPMGLAIGWELWVDNRLVVVREVHEHTIVVAHEDGSVETLDTQREDTAENAEELQGSEYEVEVDVEEGK
jgi:hypothetical protein